MLALLFLIYAGVAAMPMQSGAGAETLPAPIAESVPVPAPQRLAQAPAPAAPVQTAPPPIVSPPPVAAPPPAAPPVQPAPAAPADSAAVREELQLWTTIKDTNRPEEIEAFLLAYPNGRLASLARRRLDEIRRGPVAQPRPPAPAAPVQAAQPPASPAQTLMGAPSAAPAPNMPGTSGPGASAPSQAAPAGIPQPFILTRAIVMEIQERLYGLNYYSGPINGNFGKQTADAITGFQQKVGIPVNGAIDPVLLQKLREARGVSTWGAVAFSARGGWGASWAKPTRKIAETEAMAICRRNSRTSCKLIATPGTACTALSTYDVRGRNGRRFWGAYVATRASGDESRNSALENCRKDSPNPDACQITVIICGDKGQMI